MQTQICQNCKESFPIDQVDQDFYAKIHAPWPTFCPTCRFQRRAMFRNERNLHHRVCDLCSVPVVSVFAPEKPQPVYCGKCWWSDNWDPLEYGVEYDQNVPFFEQLKNLFARVPQMARVVSWESMVNSEYSNHAGSCKDCVFLFNADFCQNVLYGSTIAHTEDALDLYTGSTMSLCYEVVNGEKCSRCFFSQNITSCVDVSFSRDCSGCVNCFGCVNLRNKSYCVFNKQVSKEEFQNIVDSYNLHTRDGIERAIADSEEFFIQHPRRYLNEQKNLNATGNYVYNSKNAKECFSIKHAEDVAYCQFLTLPTTRDAYDLTEWGSQAETIVEGITVGENAQNVRYSANVWSNVQNVEYSMLCTGGLTNLFGCTSLRKKEYCILNKQYTKDEYNALRAKIIREMDSNPYIDSIGRIWKYGEFFPYDLSFFGYNESWAAQYFPLTRGEALAKGFKWRDVEKKAHQPTVLGAKFDTNIKTADKINISKEVVSCVACADSFKILAPEFELLKRFNLALPRECPLCRSNRRLSKMGMPKLYDRTCDKCHNSIRSNFQADVPETVYCETCYQQEIV